MCARLQMCRGLLDPRLAVQPVAGLALLRAHPTQGGPPLQEPHLPQRPPRWGPASAVQPVAGLALSGHTPRKAAHPIQEPPHLPQHPPRWGPASAPGRPCPPCAGPGSVGWGGREGVWGWRERGRGRPASTPARRSSAAPPPHEPHAGVKASNAPNQPPMAMRLEPARFLSARPLYLDGKHVRKQQAVL